MRSLGVSVFFRAWRMCWCRMGWGLYICITKRGSSIKTFSTKAMSSGPLTKIATLIGPFHSRTCGCACVGWSVQGYWRLGVDVLVFVCGYGNYSDQIIKSLANPVHAQLSHQRDTIFHPEAFGRNKSSTATACAADSFNTTTVSLSPKQRCSQINVLLTEVRLRVFGAEIPKFASTAGRN